MLRVLNVDPHTPELTDDSLRNSAQLQSFLKHASFILKSYSIKEMLCNYIFVPILA